jgi:radical SAM superfamily enzyme YgiQ (UPF0313 family)
MSHQSTANILLVGFQDQDNLGLRYLSSRLREKGHHTRIISFSKEVGPILKVIKEFNPLIVGFSLIFQYMTPDFSDLIASLRQGGVKSHFTIGGHYPSFEYETLLKSIPGLDSVVRFEGEDVLLELVDCILNGKNHRKIDNIARRDADNQLVVNPSRAGGKNLDSLPWPDRDDIDYLSMALPMASILGSRGCSWDCSFCSNTAFYKGNGTRGRRFRNPTDVVDEIEYLHSERGVQAILWQDDDFLAGGRKAVQWAHNIAKQCIDRGLHNGVRWKISCRSDEIDSDIIDPLIAAGLTHVYLGVESGAQTSLSSMNKRLSPGDHFNAKRILQDKGLSFDFGFMLLYPWSTFETVRSELRFLQDFAGDGVSPAGFSRMLAYAGTPVEDQLAADNRLKKGDVTATYSFLDPRLDFLWEWLYGTYGLRNQDSMGTYNLLRLLNFEAAINLPDRSTNPVYREALKGIISVSNTIMVQSIFEAMDYLETRSTIMDGDPFLTDLTAYNQVQDLQIKKDLTFLLERWQC